MAAVLRLCLLPGTLSSLTAHPGLAYFGMNLGSICAGLFAGFQECQKKLEHKLGLDSYLLKPVQRITKYQLLLKVSSTNCVCVRVCACVCALRYQTVCALYRSC